MAVTDYRCVCQEMDYQEAGVDTGMGEEELPDWYLDTLPSLMASALTYATVATAPGHYDTKQLLQFQQFLRQGMSMFEMFELFPIFNPFTNDDFQYFVLSKQQTVLFHTSNLFIPERDQTYLG